MEYRNLGRTGTVVSTLATYPLDLVNTRLKVQRQLRADGAIGPEDAYGGVADAFRTIYTRDGAGIGAFFAGLGPDLAKSAADSFLFFLFYTVSFSPFQPFPLPPLWIAIGLADCSNGTYSGSGRGDYTIETTPAT